MKLRTIVLGLVLTVVFVTWVAQAQDIAPRTQYPVTVENCGRTLTVEASPQRVLATWQNTGEILLALGLEDRLVGVYYGQPYAELPEYAGRYDSFNLFPRLQRPSRELIVSANADFVFSAYPTSDFNADRGLVTAEEFIEAGANVYGLTDQCIDNPQTFSLDNSYQDILNIGVIFDVQDRAEALVEEMQERIAAVQDRVADLEPVDVIMIDRGNGPIGVWGRGYESVLIELAGGRNLFGDAETSYVEVSLEAFATQDPDLFIIYDYEDAEGVPDEAEYAAFLSETFPNMRAAHSEQYALIGAETNTGIRAPLAVERLAEQFHPEAFEMGAERTEYPVTIESCGETITVEARPERAVGYWTGQTSIMVALGAADSIIGRYFFFESDVNVPPPAIADAVFAIPLLGNAGEAPSREAVIAAQPDFYYAGGPNAFPEGQASREDWESVGAVVYNGPSSCAAPDDLTIELLYQEIMQVGIIFDAQAEAAEIVQGIRDQIADVQEQIAGREPMTVVWIDGFSSDPIFALGDGYFTDLLRQAGGINLFVGANYDTPPSLEDYAASNPDVLLIFSYGKSTDELIPRYREVFANSSAVQNDQVGTNTYLTSLRTGELIEQAARVLHPEAFE
ncbi:MAG: ABC transporter substrate-binding protein [Anaerolineae bacterium]|nr:ABC transporter substrate-binding protein [Anaerolineae bacterium]